MELIFWSVIGVILYTYLGYFILLWIFSAIIKTFRKVNQSNNLNEDDWPAVTLMVAAFNEEKIIKAKLENTFALDYPKEKLDYIWIIDGSNDHSSELLQAYPQIDVLYKPERQGKTAAINRGMQHVSTPIVIFSDANSMLSKNTIREMVQLFQHKKTGCVAGEKHITKGKKIVSSGEGVYWHYENQLKRLESTVFSTVGAAGELFAIRTGLFSPIPEDTILDDFELSLGIARKGYRIKFAPEAKAFESASASLQEEEKRKVRIASGCIQTFVRNIGLLNPFKTGFLAFQYFSHKVLRWLIVPFSLLLLFPVSFGLAYTTNFSFNVYTIAFLLFAMLLVLLLIGHALRKRDLPKILYLPYYLYFMNISIIKGYITFFRRKHSAIWEKAQRI
ncbi:MAG: glycosyltransferase [Bacteroidetes bacterium]|jgi:cellulose synthase/poly-beta-1,6-N-acetylglucosamine synthase-like glycosyltransferase|nr:glycosyltransferase [Bacteroidota bacterium]